MHDTLSSHARRVCGSYSIQCRRSRRSSKDRDLPTYVHHQRSPRTIVHLHLPQQNPNAPTNVAPSCLSASPTLRSFVTLFCGFAGPPKNCWSLPFSSSVFGGNLSTGVENLPGQQRNQTLLHHALVQGFKQLLINNGHAVTQNLFLAMAFGRFLSYLSHIP